MGEGVVGGAYARSVGNASAASAFERNMIDDMTRLGTLCRSADGGYVAAFSGAACDVVKKLSALAGSGFRGRADGELSIVEFPSFAAFLDGSLACCAERVPDDAFLDFSDIADGVVMPDPESEMALHEVFSALGQVLVERPLPVESAQSRDLREILVADLPGLMAALQGTSLKSRVGA